ncbi:RagB/SusD family nutrient uptake outer membrane protein [Mesonia aestuariivivens]|uniref:RagB/SusD family nutrient uptake outer membrane protein n=1 Tax=Mesonia aestuariivivens TaxID=2796128 RepID=A0ABS6W4Y0_9FLAO|nr:RagB/SusD family nutrient uptake outer membrane protein [Mesonia aestuariivivens]MBW2962915.1 RagB/SusD family nutrient uptake outer membrane protein [Mesonia aestuariivivens]
MKIVDKIKQLSLVVVLVCISSCQDWLEVEEPDHKLVSSEVFASDETAESAMRGIYNQLYQASYSAGWLGSVSVLGGLSSDNLALINTNALDLLQFQQHSLLPDNTYNESLWRSAYNIIYMTNSLLEGIQTANNLSPELATRLQGEATFIRAFTYFYLTNLYGEVPLVLTTDYETNALLEASTTTRIQEQIVNDLEMAISQLEGNAVVEERTQVNAYTAKALLARVHLYLENWELAEQYSSEVIAQSGTYSLLTDMNEVFLANSQEAIWQLSPTGAGTVTTNTNEGSVFIINPYFPSLSYVKLTEELVNAMGAEDKRKLNWVNYHEELEVYYAYKYKIQNSSAEVTEYSMLMRLAEQYLIRAEARARQNNLQGAIADIDHIKERAGVPLLADSNSGISQQALLEEILIERRKELFTEWGHRWLDAKRTGKANEFFAAESPGWQETDLRYPIPAKELLSNPNLIQHPGY